MTKLDFISELGIKDINPGGFSTEWLGSGSDLESTTPADGSIIATVKPVSYTHLTLPTTPYV